MPVCGNYLFFELPKKIVLNPKDGANGTYQIILMDIQMPVMNGYDATRKIRRMGDPHKANIPIVAMTANAFSEDRQAALDAGMNDHIAKPIDMNILVSTLRKYL